MLKKRAQFYESLLIFTDILFISIAWILSYFLRFHVKLVPVYYDIPSLQKHLVFLLPIMLLWVVLFKAFRLSEVGWSGGTSKGRWRLFKASTAMFLLLVVLTFFARKDLSRVVVLFFWLINILTLSLGRFLFSYIFQYFRQKGYTVANAVIVGSGELPRTIAEKLLCNSFSGINVVGLISEDTREPRTQIQGIQILGTYKDIQRVIKQYNVDLIVIGTALEHYHGLEDILKNIGSETVDIKIVPDMQRYTTLHREIEELDGLPFITLQGSPLYGWNIVLKRTIDILVSLVGLIFLLPVTMITALLVFISSPGPIFYRQERASLNGKKFIILKFRTMKVDAEEEGPVWPISNDPRCTWIGKYLRRMRLDEIPQLINVLKGDMSLIGPRPERPIFIDKFKDKIPQYMLRNKVLAGITGLAQINEWHEYIPLEKRIEYDLYYIKTWSLGLDLTILFLTLWRTIFQPKKKDELAFRKGEMK